MQNPPPLPPLPLPPLQWPPLPNTHGGVYSLPPGAAGKSKLLFAGAAGLLLVSIGGFVISLRLPHDPFRQNVMTTLPMIGAITCLTAALALRRSPREVRVTAGGVTVADAGGRTRELPWERIAVAAKVDRSMGTGKALKLYDGDGKVLANLSDELTGFDFLVDDLQRQLAARPHARATAVETRRLRKQAAFLIFGGVCAIALGAATGWMAYRDATAERLLRDSTVPGEAIVVRKFVAPNGRTHRIEYRVTGANGQPPLENVQVNTLFWVGLTEGNHVPVHYVPADPGISRLAIGQVDEKEMSPGTEGLMSALVGAMGVFFLSVGGWQWFKAGKAKPRAPYQAG